MQVNGQKIYLENQAELNDPIFTNVEWSHYYRNVPESYGWRVSIGFRKPNDPNWWEAETDWAWLPDNLRTTLVNANN